jgi:sterol 14-demethylase
VEFAKNPVNFIAMCQKAKGDLFTVPMGPKKLTFLLGPECSAPFYQNKDDVMSQSEVYSFMTPVFGKNVVYDAPEKKRLQQMQHMATGLRSTRLEVYVPKFEAETIAYLKRWGDSGEVNILDALSELTILTASRCLHGDDVREDLFEEVSQIYHDLDKGVTPLSFFWPGAPTAAHAKRDAARLKMVEIFGKVIRARRENDAKNNVVRTDILQVFMDMKYKDGSVLTDDEITGLLIALLFAGQHTSSITSTWTTMFLLHNKDSMDKAMAEQHKVLGGDNKKPLTLELVKAMDFMYASVKESLRLHPPLIMLMRQAMVDVKTTLNGKEYVIPAGDICVTSPAVSSRMASVFPEPDKFKPERFENDGEARMPQFSYLGFGGGRHQCMGQAFGLLQVSTITSILLRNFDFELVTPDKFPEPDYEAMVVGPKNHCMLRYKKKADAFI